MRRYTRMLIQAVLILTIAVYFEVHTNILAKGNSSSFSQTPTSLLDHFLPRNFWPNKIAFWSQEDGIVLGTVGSKGEPSVGVVAQTKDAGRIWKITMASYGTYLFSGMPDSHTVWVNQIKPSDQGSNTNTVSFRSTNMGRTWKAVNDVSKRSLFPYWVTDSFGWVDASHYILYTRNAGKTWTKEMQASRPEFNMVGEPDFVNSSVAWVLCVGQPGTGMQGKAIFKTTNGGKSWKPIVEVPFLSHRVIGVLSALGYASGISFLPDGVGWLWETRGGGFTTSNGGKQWHPMKITKPDWKEANDGDLLTDRSGYLLLHIESPSQAMELLYTDDAAKTWTVIQRWNSPFND